MVEESNRKLVIIDTDMGADDAWAILSFLKADKCNKDIKILAITCVNGNTTMNNVLKSIYHLLHSYDRLDIPIYKGATEAIISRKFRKIPYNGENGMFDVNFWKYDIHENDIPRSEHAVRIIRDQIIQHPNKISLICLGPLTNVALAAKTYPEIRDKIGELLMMGGNYKGVGSNILTEFGTTTNSAEFNCYVDPVAVHIVLESLKCPITMLPMEGCRLESLAIPKEWRFTTFKNVDHDYIQFLNRVEQRLYNDVAVYRPCDAFLAAVILFPQCVRKQERYHVTVELHGIYTIGQMVVDHSGEKDHNVTIIELLNEDEVKKALIWSANP